MKKTAAPVSLKGRPLKEKLILFFAFGFGFGFIRPAPGTWGTIPGVLIAALLMFSPTLHILALIIVTLLGIWLCQKASDILGVHDHGGIVIDEIAGVMLTLLFFQPTLLNLFLGFCWFRLFDILKPFPIRWIDKHVHGGLGIMLDDILAGLFAMLALYLSLLVLQ